MIWISVLLITIFMGMAIFELLLALGRLYGNFVWGGQYKVLPRNLRIASLISSLFYALLIVVILSHERLVSVFSRPMASILIWSLVILFGIGVVMNAISRSKLERNTFTPIAIVIFMLCLILALS